MNCHYILIGQTPVETDLFTMAEWMNHRDNRKVAFTRLFDMVNVSTVFLCLDHSFGTGPPILFESMAFWMDERGYEQDRCSTWTEAEAMHREMIARVTRPRAALAYFRRAFRNYWSKARDNWRDADKPSDVTEER